MVKGEHEMKKLAMLLVLALLLQLIMPMSVYGAELPDASSTEKHFTEEVSDEDIQTNVVIQEEEPTKESETIKEEQKKEEDASEERETVRVDETENEDSGEQNGEIETEEQRGSEPKTVNSETEEFLSDVESDNVEEIVFDTANATEIEGFIQEKYYRGENGYELFIGVAMPEWNENTTELANVAYQLDNDKVIELGTIVSDKFAYNKPTWSDEYGGCLTISLDAVPVDANEGTHSLSIWFTVGGKGYKVEGMTEFIDEMSKATYFPDLNFGEYISSKKGTDISIIEASGYAFDKDEEFTQFKLVASGTNNIVIAGAFDDARTSSGTDYRYSYTYTGKDNLEYRLDSKMSASVYKMSASVSGIMLENNISDGYYDILCFTSKGRELRAEKAFYASSKPVISHVLVENGKYWGFNSDNTGDYVSVVVYGLNLGKNNIPTFYNPLNSAVLASYIDSDLKCGYGLGDTKSLFRLKKSKSDLGVKEDVNCSVKISGSDVIYINGEDHCDTSIESIDCAGVFLGEYLEYNSQGIFKLYIGEGIDCDTGDIITCKMSSQNEYVETATIKRNKNGKYIEFGKESDIYKNFTNNNLFKIIKNGSVLTESTSYSYYWCYDDISFNWNLEIPANGSWEIRPLGELIKIYSGKNTSDSTIQLSLNDNQLRELGQYSTVEIRIYDANGEICNAKRVYLPETTADIPTEDENIKQLVETGSSVFQFYDQMTGVPITNGRVCIEEEFSGTHYYNIKNNGYVEVPLSKDCKRVFISTSFKGYENLGGWVDLSYYRSESGVYTFKVNPNADKYNPKMPSINTSVRTSAPPVETTDGDISLFNMDMDFALNFGKGLKFERTYDKNDRTVKVAFSTEGKVSYDAIEAEYKASGAKSGKTLDEEFENVDEAFQPGKACGVDVKVVVKGYLKCNEKGSLIEGGAIVFVKGSGAVEYRPACTAGVAYAKFELGLSMDGTWKFVYVDGNLDSSGIIKFEPYATIAAGIGWKLAHVEVGATGKFPITLTIPYKSDKESLNIDAVFEVYGETVLFCFGGKNTLEFKENIWPAMSLANYAALNNFNSAVSSDNLEILPRDYLSSPNTIMNTYNAQKASGLTSSDSFRYSEISADSGVFKENNVQYVKLSNGMEILAWIHDFGDKSAVNRTTLVYSINKNDGNGWSSITPVCSDTSTADYYPHMIAEENKAYLVWNKASKVFDNDVSFDDVCRQMDVYVSVFENGKFLEPQMVSDADNELMEFSPLAAVNGENAAVAWLTNSENDYHYTKGSNSIYICEYKDGVWSSPVCCVQNLNYVSDYDVDYVEGLPTVIYAEDADNVSDTQDGTVYYVQNGMKTMIGDASYHAEIVDLCDDAVYFSGGNKVYKASGSWFSSIYDTGIETDNFSIVKNTSGAEAVMFYKQNGFARDVYVSYCRNGSYTSPVPMISDGSKVTNFVPVYNNDGTISIAYNEEELLTGSEDIYGLTDMVVKKNVNPNVFFVDSDLAYDAYNVAPGNTIEFSTKACNYTTHPISQVKLVLSGSRSGDIYKGIQDVDIPVGEQKWISLSYTLPETVVNEYYTLTVTPTGFDDIDLSNNSSRCELGYSDIAISDLKIENNIINGTITNIGYQTAKNVSLTIKEDSEENRPISVLSYEKSNLAVGECWEFSQEINPAEYESVGDVKYYLLSAETDSLENNYGNDSATVYSEPIAATGISLDKNTLTLKKNTSAVLKATVMPEDATFKNAVYLSSANDVVAVDNKGNVYALSEGNAIVTAYTLDGSCSAQCEITVEGGTEESYQISSRGLELMIGDSSSLYVKDGNGNNAQNVVWSSTDENVVAITQDGTVKTVGAGIALLVARIDDFADVCMVRVSDYSIVLDCEDVTICLGDKKQLIATVTPSGGTVTYTSENPNIAAVSDTGLITGAGIGTTVIHAAAGNFTVDCRVTVTEREGGVPEETDGVLPEDIPADGKIPDGLWIASIADASYIGEAITPDAHVYDSNVRLKAGRDYAISYKNNVNASQAAGAKAPTIVITGKGNYSGKETATFNILPADLSGDDFSAEEFYVKTSKKAQNPIPQIYYMGTKLKHKKDFTIKYSNTSGIYAQAGEYSVTVTGTGNYTGTRTLTLTAVAKIPKKPAVSIAKASLSGFEKSFSYTGKACRQQCTLSVNTDEGEKMLIEGTDYTVRYTNNVKAGTATVTYSGKNSYTGKLKKTYKITPYNISDDYGAKLNYENFLECVYAKGGSKPKPVITFDGRRMTEGVDYTLRYKNNKTVYPKQTPCIIVKGKGSFKGNLTIYFTINPQDLSKMTLVSCDKVYKDKVGNYKIVPKLMDLDGKLLSAGKDFDKNSITYAYEKDATLENGTSRKAGDTVEDTDIPRAGTPIRVTLTCGTGGNYTGTFTGVYHIVKSDIKSAKVTIPNQTYTGKEIILDKSQITVTLSGTTLKPEDYDIILYTDNVKKGKASVTIKGKGNYGGTKTVKFNIGAKGFLWWWKR